MVRGRVTLLTREPGAVFLIVAHSLRRPKQHRRQRRNINFNLRPLPDCVIRCSVRAYILESARALVLRQALSAKKYFYFSIERSRK